MSGDPANLPRTMTCALCGTLFVPADLRHVPFCSERCQQIDLGRWLGESYAMPLDGQEDLEVDELEN